MTQRQQLLEKIKLVKESGRPVIVEGKKDIAALKKLGLQNIFEIKGSIFSFCEKISERFDEVILLTDLDKEGRKLYSRIKKNLERNGVKVFDSFRNFLYKETTLTQIEGIDTYLENIS